MADDDSGHRDEDQVRPRIPAEASRIIEISDFADSDEENPLAVIEVTDFTVVPMGDGHAYRQITYTDAVNNCKFRFEVRDGIAGCTRIEMLGGEKFIRTKDLTDIRLDDIRIEAYALTGVQQRSDGSFVHRIDYQRDRKRVERIKTRRKMTPDLLRRVAELYDGTPGSVEQVKGAFNVADRQAWRYIKAAREQGLIK